MQKEITKEMIWDAIAKDYFIGGTASAKTTNTIIARLYSKKDVRFANAHNELLSNGWIMPAKYPLSPNLFQISLNGINWYNKFGSYSKWKEYHDKIEKLGHSKLENEEKLSRWKVKTFWFLFGFALLGSSYATFDFIRNLYHGEYSKEQQTILPTNNNQWDNRIKDSLSIKLF